MRMAIAALLISCFITSCIDHPVAIVNHSSSPVQLKAQLSKHFLSGERAGQTQIFPLDPGDSLHCGFATAGLQDEVPFNSLIIYASRDSIRAEGPLAIVDLFDRNRWGYLATPYRLVIRD